MKLLLLSRSFFLPALSLLPRVSADTSTSSVSDPGLQPLRRYLANCESFFTPMASSNLYSSGYASSISLLLQQPADYATTEVSDMLIQSYLSCKLNPPPATWNLCFSNDGNSCSNGAPTCSCNTLETMVKKLTDSTTKDLTISIKQRLDTSTAVTSHLQDFQNLFGNAKGLAKSAAPSGPSMPVVFKIPFSVLRRATAAWRDVGAVWAEFFVLVGRKIW